MFLTGFRVALADPGDFCIDGEEFGKFSVLWRIINVVYAILIPSNLGQIMYTKLYIKVSSWKRNESINALIFHFFRAFVFLHSHVF